MGTKRVFVYVDGFNLYHALDDLNQNHLKWLNLWALSENLISQDGGETLITVKYFSAYATWRERSMRRHQRYVAAFPMARKRHSDEDILKLLREIELNLASGNDVATACRSVGISDATYYNWRKRFGGMAKSQLSEKKALEKENQRLKKIVAELELDKLILKESLDFLKPRA